ncbi:hypothetical protein [uncultured Allomuricauda sp.]|uniref:hypothetical protein n=1 Tax=Flagellimonas aurea TaxID=2915619 RepID=UPI002591EBDE|nr:hypothetical protein [uncultured Allomuricauda sp.]
MKIFPTKELRFKLIDGQVATLDRLNRRTEISKNLTSSYTDQSFRGIINGNEFKIISSVIGKGAFCVMTGEIGSDYGTVSVEINKAFKILLGIILLFPIVGLVLFIITTPDEFSMIMVLTVIGQILLIRFVGIWYFFRRFSDESLSRLRDVLDIEWQTSVTLKR